MPQLTNWQHCGKGNNGKLIDRAPIANKKYSNENPAGFNQDLIELIQQHQNFLLLWGFVQDSFG